MSDYRECRTCQVTFACPSASDRVLCDDCTPPEPAPEAPPGPPTMATLTTALREAHLAVKAQLRIEYPAGKKIQALLQANHLRPSPCTIVGHIGGEDGKIRVRLKGGHVTSVSYLQVRP